MKDYYEKYCSKCKHKELGETDSPCKECIDKFFDDCRNPNRTFVYFEKENKDGKSDDHIL